MSRILERPDDKSKDGQATIKEASIERVSLSPMDSEGQEIVEQQEVRSQNVAPRPKAPTQAEIDDHEPLHLEYRSWCPHCVYGRGHPNHHRASNSEVVDATWQMDYALF